MHLYARTSEDAREHPDLVQLRVPDADLVVDRVHPDRARMANSAYTGVSNEALGRNVAGIQPIPDEECTEDRGNGRAITLSRHDILTIGHVDLKLTRLIEHRARAADRTGRGQESITGSGKY